jgi:hypothetical protein
MLGTWRAPEDGWWPGAAWIGSSNVLLEHRAGILTFLLLKNNKGTVF